VPGYWRFIPICLNAKATDCNLDDSLLINVMYNLVILFIFGYCPQPNALDCRRGLEGTLEMQKRAPTEASQQPAPVYQAILVMDSREVRTPLRNQAQPMASWSQLYQAGPYHLDLSLRWDQAGAHLAGQVICREQVTFERALVCLRQGTMEVSKSLDLSGRFSLDLESAGDCHLEFLVQNEVICLGRIKLS